MLEIRNLELITRHKNECIDHIAISKEFIDNHLTETIEWNLDKSLSDHKGIAVTLSKL